MKAKLVYVKDFHVAVVLVITGYIIPTVRCSEKLKRVNTTIDLECLGLHWLEARLRFLAREQGPVQEVRALNPSH